MHTILLLLSSGGIHTKDFNADKQKFGFSADAVS